MLDEADNSAEESEGPSIEDTIRAVVEGHNESIEQAAEPAEEKPSKPRDEKGKFAKAENPAEEVRAEEIKPEPVKRKPPGSLRKELQDKWDTLDPIAQDEFERREADFHKGIQSYKEKAQIADQFDQVVSQYPVMQQLKQQGGNPLQAVNNLLNADHVLRNGSQEQKVNAARQILQEYGITLGEDGTQFQVDPLMQKMQLLESTVSNLTHSQQQAQLEAQRRADAALEQQITEWSNGKEFFQELRPAMSALLQTGEANSLDDAYEQAMWAKPQIRQQVLAKQQEAAKAEQAKKAAEARKAAYSNIPVRGRVRTNSEPKGTQEDTIRATVMNAFK